LIISFTSTRSARAVKEDRQIGSAAPDVDHRHPEILFGTGQHRLAGGQRLQHQIIYLDPSLLDGLVQIHDLRLRGGDDVRLDLEAVTGHPERIVDPVLAVHDVLARDHMQHLTIVRQGLRARGLDRPIDVILGDLVHIRGDRHDATAVLAHDMVPGNADQGRADLVARGPLGLIERLADRRRRLVDVDDDTLAQTLRRCHAHAHDSQPVILAHLTDQGADLCCADIDADNDPLLGHPASSPGI